MPGVRAQGDEGRGRGAGGVDGVGDARRALAVGPERGQSDPERVQRPACPAHRGGSPAQRRCAGPHGRGGGRELRRVERRAGRRADGRLPSGVDRGGQRIEGRTDAGVRLVECGAGHLDAVVECRRIRRECRTGPEGERNAGEHRGCRDPGDGTRPYHRPMDLAAELRGLPKAELHQHIDGAVRPATAVELAAEAGIALAGVTEARRRLVAPTHCRDQAELLSYFDLPIALLQTTAALTRVSAELVADLAADGVRYAELRWAPRLHLEAGLSVEEVIGAVADGVAQAGGGAEGRGPLIGLIVTAMRSHPPAANVRLAEAAASFGAPVLGFDLAGPEAAYPASPQAAAFLAAERGGLATTAHAGEVPGPQRIVEALDLGVRRIAHGVTAAKDADVMAIVRARDVTLDLCPTSNVQAGIVADLAAHPLAALHRAGISVTISTDDRTVSDVALTEELARASRVIGITDAELAAISTNAFRRAFAPRDVMAPLLVAAERAWGHWLAARIS